MSKKLSKAKEAAKKVVEKVELAHAREKVVEVLKNVVKVERDIAMARKMVEAKNIELEVATTIKITKLKTNLSNSKKGIEKF